MHEAIAYNGDSQVTDLTYTAATAGACWPVTTTVTTTTAGLRPLLLQRYQHVGFHAQPLGAHHDVGPCRVFLRPPAAAHAASYTNWANPPTTDNRLAYDVNGNRDNTGETTSPGNRVTYDGNYYYLYDAEGNRTFKFKSTSGALD